MPHAGINRDEPQEPEQESRSGFSAKAGLIADKARAHPRTAVAAGAAVLAGAVAAAAIPLVRSRSASEPKGGKASAKKKS
jgi:hypothetical protein